VKVGGGIVLVPLVAGLAVGLGAVAVCLAAVVLPVVGGVIAGRKIKTRLGQAEVNFPKPDLRGRLRRRRKGAMTAERELGEVDVNHPPVASYDDPDVQCVSYQRKPDSEVF
jgi:hypothetical protein